jgi:Glycosyl transferase family 2
MGEMTQILSIVTAVYNPVGEYLLAAYESLRDQSLPAGWEWEWLVQEDGESGTARRILPHDGRTSHGSNRHLGVALTRNLALARGNGPLIKNLDQDDVLADGVLMRDIDALDRHPEISWTTSRVLDLLPDGSTVGFEGDPPGGPIEPGTVYEYWRTHDYRASVHPTTLCIRRELAVALGGWMAIPGSDDTGLLIAASVVAKGYFHPQVGLLYRKWPGQASASTAHSAPLERSLRMSLIDARARALSRGTTPGARSQVSQ